MQMAAQIGNPCGVCLREVTNRQYGIKCDGACDRWFHRDCVKLSKTEYERLAADENQKWQCLRADCVRNNENTNNALLNQMAGFASLLSELSSKMDKIANLPDKIDALDMKLTNFEKRITRTEERLNALETAKIEPKAAAAPDFIISELNDRTRRANNIMIFNLNESTSNDVNELKRHDKELSGRILEATCPGLISYQYMATRIGKKDPKKTRPLKIILQKASDAMEVLKSFSSDHMSAIDKAFDGVRILRDRTPHEIKFLNNLKEELKLRQDKGETGLTIKFRNGVPEIIKQKN